MPFSHGILAGPTSISIGDETADEASGSDKIDAKQTFTVTSIPAGHCPGSVMFMLETADKRILYTGDIRSELQSSLARSLFLIISFIFRLDKRAIESIKAFRGMRDDVLPFDRMYFDSTFFSLQYSQFPQQRESVDAIIDLTEKWLNKTDQNVVVIRMPANYGYEFLLVRLAQHFGNVIHMSSENVGDYSFLPELDGSYSGIVSKNTRIHFQCDSHAKWTTKNWPVRKLECCPSLAEKYIRIIRPTAQRWENWRNNAPIVAPHENLPETFYVCYSNHSSFTELKHLIQYINAKKDEFNVMPREKRQELHETYKHIVKDVDERGAEPAADEPNSNPIITFSRIVIDSQKRPGEDEALENRPKIKRRKKIV